jgi:phospholipase/lecithinase/hemolysin
MSSRRILPGVLLTVLMLTPLRAARAGGLLGGIGVLGDSYSDEYRFYPPDRSTARNWVEILAEARGLDFGRFSTAPRGEPRNQGFAYNWARSDATTDELIAAGQHTGVAAQVARGEVGLVFVFIGGNDFINALRSPDPAAALRTTLPRALANYRVAIRTVMGASPDVRLVLATLPDIRDLPEFARTIREGRIPPGLADAYSAAIRRYNAQIRSIASSDSRIALIDLDLTARAANLLSRDCVYVGGRKLDRRRPANDLDHFFLADVRHPGTLGQGLMARAFVEAVNARFGAGIEPIRDEDLLSIATSPPAVAPRDNAVGLADLGRPRSEEKAPVEPEPAER